MNWRGSNQVNRGGRGKRVVCVLDEQEFTSTLIDGVYDIEPGGHVCSELLLLQNE